MCGLYDPYLWKVPTGLNRVQTREDGKKQMNARVCLDNRAP